MTEEFPGSNKRNKRNTASHVVVVKKKRFNFSKQDKDAPVVAPESAKASEVKPSTVSPKIDAHEAFNSSARKTGAKVRNLDDDYSSPKPQVIEETPEVKVEKEAQKKKEKKFSVGSDHIKKEADNSDFFKPKVKENKEQKKDKKSFLEDLTLVSHSKEKTFNCTSEASAFLTNKGKYEEASGRKKANFYDNQEVEQERLRSIASIKRAREKAKRDQQLFGGGSDAAKEKVKEVVIPETITVQELANRMSERSADLVKELMKMGMMITASKPIDADTAELLLNEFGMSAKRVSHSDIEKILDDDQRDNEGSKVPRSAVVSVMGHVDHGKTSLLDALRETDVVSGESGGITQHIGASRIKVDKDRYVTFLDTPGHEAFTAMRLRGAHVTDMVILVVAADDGVKDQTIEAINHAKAAEIPIIVAINKIDKEGADPRRVTTELLEHGVIVEDMGGEVLAIEVSAKDNKNLDKILDAIELQAEMLELKSNPNCKASGVVIESKIDKNRGVLATLLVQHGTLKVGDIVVSGTSYGKVRTLTNEKRQKLKQAMPSEPAELLGLDEAPEAGEGFHVVESEKVARDIVEYRVNKKKDKEAARRSKRTLEDIFSDMTDDETKKKLPLVVKGDVNGSVEAIVNSLEKLSNDEVNIQVIHSAVGGITESDVVLAQASGAIILSFNVRLAGNVPEKESKEVDIRYYSIIYDLVDDIKSAVNGMLKPIIKEVELGKGEIRQVIDLSKHGKIAGTYVKDGVAKRSGRCRVIRDSVVISDTAIKALKHYKDDVKEVNNGTECGISFENCTDFKEGDQLEFFELTEEARK